MTDIDPRPPFAVNNLKNQRFEDEVKFKVLKWSFCAPRREFVDQLQNQMITAEFNT